MSHNLVSISGTVATEPQSRLVNGESVVTSFRLVSTARRLNDRNEWIDGRTTWVTVQCWRSLARNVERSLKVGHRVVVQGKLVSSTWDTEQGRRYRVDVEADSIGPDLTFGTSEFTKVNWSQPLSSPGQSQVDELADEVERAAAEVDLSALFGAGEEPVSDAVTV